MSESINVDNLLNMEWQMFSKFQTDVITVAIANITVVSEHVMAIAKDKSSRDYVETMFLLASLKYCLAQAMPEEQKNMFMDNLRRIMTDDQVKTFDDVFKGAMQVYNNGVSH